MKPDEIRQLLGGYASGTLSDSEKKLLFDAALEDQVLFDAMADEQALKDLLDDPESRGYLQAVLDEVHPESAQPEKIVSIKSARTELPPPAPAMRAPATISGAASVVKPRMAAETSPSPVPPPGQQQHRRRIPPVWWGMLAAAALAAVSVVGILRFDHPTAPVEVAEVKKPTAPAPTAGKESEPQPPRVAEPKPAAVAHAPKAVGPAPANPTTSSPVQLENPSLDKRKEADRPSEKTTELAKAEDRGANSTPPAKDEAPGGAPRARVPESNAAQTKTAAEPAPPVMAAAPPPVPAPQPQNGISPQPATVAHNASQQVPRDQVQVAGATQPDLPVPSAREQYFSAGQSSADAKSAQAEQTKSAPKDKKASRGAFAVGRTAPAASASGSGGVANGPVGAVSASPAKPSFAMRVRLLRKTPGGDFAAVPPNTPFKAGEEVVLIIEKNSGGSALVRRAGSRDPVPMAIETNAMARTVPLTLTGPLELSVTLTRNAAARRLEAPQQSAAQATESADDMIYVAEPAGASPQALVARIVIRVE